MKKVASNLLYTYLYILSRLSANSAMITSSSWAGPEQEYDVPPPPTTTSY
jgi:hypothetical protein